MQCIKQRHSLFFLEFAAFCFIFGYLWSFMVILVILVILVIWEQKGRLLSWMLIFSLFLPHTSIWFLFSRCIVTRSPTRPISPPQLLHNLDSLWKLHTPKRFLGHCCWQFGERPRINCCWRVQGWRRQRETTFGTKKRNGSSSRWQYKNRHTRKNRSRRKTKNPGWNRIWTKTYASILIYVYFIANQSVIPWFEIIYFSFCLSFRVKINFSPPRIRCAFHWLVNYRYFDWFIMIFIGFSSIALASEDPVVEKSQWNQFLETLDYVFTAVFAMEMVVKIIDLGVILHPGSYLRGEF